MRTLTIATIISIEILLQYKESLQGIMAEVKQDLQDKNVVIPYHEREYLYFSEYGYDILAAAHDFGAYSSMVSTIGVSKFYWERMPRIERKKLLLHEYLHSAYDVRHCYHPFCVMIQGSIHKEQVPYEVLLDTAVKHHLTDRYNTEIRFSIEEHILNYLGAVHQKILRVWSYFVECAKNTN